MSYVLDPVLAPHSFSNISNRQEVTNKATEITQIPEVQAFFANTQADTLQVAYHNTGLYIRIDGHNWQHLTPTENTPSARVQTLCQEMLTLAQEAPPLYTPAHTAATPAPFVSTLPSLTSTVSTRVTTEEHQPEDYRDIMAILGGIELPTELEEHKQEEPYHI